ncbi:MAG: hypothetical protein ABI904_03855 [Chloroflexota bacterium]
MKRNIILLASLLGLLAGCAAPTQSPVPTPYPPEYLPTVIMLTADAANVAGTETTVALTPVIALTETIEPTVSPIPTQTRTPLPTSTPTSIPGHALGAIRFISPGPMSKLISPIQFRADVISGESQKVKVDLYGEDGRLLSSKLLKVLNTSEGAFVSFKIPFETRAVAELGRITVSTLDKNGRVQALNSVRVLLLSSGINEINPPGNPSEPVGVFKPLAEEAVSGGVLNVKGDLWPFSLQPVVLELVSPAGQSIGLRILTIQSIDPQLFETTIPYKVTEPTLARLTIRQEDDRMSGLFYVYSQVVLLNP